MKLTLSRATLLKALAHVAGVVEKNTSIPILSHVLLEAKDGVLSLTCTDMEIAIVEQVDANVSAAGAITTSVWTMLDIVRRLPDGVDVALEHSGADRPITLRAGRYSTSMVVLDVADFPSLAGWSSGGPKNQFRLAPKALRGLLDRARFAMSNDDTRYYLQGIYLHAVEVDGTPLLRAVATDGHRLARVEEPLPDGAKDMPGVIVPRKSVNAIMKLLDEAGGVDIAITTSDTRFQAQIGRVSITTKLIDGTFPDYDRVIPRENDKVLRVGKKALLDAVGRVAAISQERQRPVKMSLARNMLVLSSASPEQGSATEEMEDGVSYDGAPLDVGFQARYLDDVVSQLSGEAEFRFATSDTPTVCQDTGDASALYVLMPMRV